MNRDRQYSGRAGSPIEIGYSRTPPRRKTEETKTSRKPTVEDYAIDDGYTVIEKPHSSAVRYDRTAVPPRRSALLEDESNPKKTRLITKKRRFDKYTLLIILCFAIIVMVVGWFVLSMLANWWTNTTDDWKYGNPRTYQTDQFVGQGDSPDHPDHFIVVNTHGQVIVIQLNTQHPNLDHIYGITTTSDPKTPVSLSFRPTGNTWAMYVIVGDTNPYTVELVSNGKQFVAPPN